MKQSKSIKSFTETTDVRDGLFSSLRYALAQMQVMNDENNGKFRNSGRIAKNVASKLQVDSEEVYDALIDTTWPRCEIPLVDGHGNMGFPPAGMEYSEMRVSDFYKELSHKDKTTDFNIPLLMPFPYVLSNGAIGGQKKGTTIPPHNLGEVIDATIALIKEPTLETKDLMQYINGPDLLVGGEILNKAELCDIYEKGYGKIKVKIVPQTADDRFYEDVSHFCNWYKLKSRKRLFKNKQIIISYNAILFDGKTTKHMSLKEILQKYIEHYKSVENISDELLCKKLIEFKKSCGERKTKA